MKRQLPALLFVFVALFLLAPDCLAQSASYPYARETENPTALDTYVAKPDSNYAYSLVSTSEKSGLTTYVLEMTSQEWRSADEVDRTIWKHWVTILRPEEVTTKTALMLISGGDNNDNPPKGAPPNIRRLATEAGAVVAQIKMVPNQPLTFAGEDRGRGEDAIIAHNWDAYMRTGDAEWPTRMPMTKSVVRAMDTVQSFCASEEGGEVAVETFVAAGASKRGWTTWTTAIVDRRVIAIVPMVIDLLNLLPSFEHHKAVYGFWAPAVNDYVRMDIMEWMGSKEWDALMGLVEPYSYRSRLTMPKLLMNATGDQFFLPDSAKFYIEDLQGPTYLRYVPNTGHGLNGSAGTSVTAFFTAVIQGASLPEYSWTYPNDDTIRVETSSKPTAVKLWQATNPEARDFRIDKLGRAYEATDLEDQGNGVYVGQVAKPEKGWTAFMIELTFPGPKKAEHVFTTPVRIIPDVAPHTYTQAEEFPKGFLSK